MARPCKNRRICAYPKVLGFTPFGDYAETVNLSIDEYEAFRLIDKMDYNQQECAKHMGVARSTVAAIYESARSKIADAVVYGKAINISGGDVFVCEYNSLCYGNGSKANCPILKNIENDKI